MGGSLNVAGKRQESATFLQRSLCNVAMQFYVCCSAAFGKNDVRIEEKRLLQCNFCSSENCSTTSVFACGMLQGWSLERRGFKLGLTENRPEVSVEEMHIACESKDQTLKKIRTLLSLSNFKIAWFGQGFFHALSDPLNRDMRQYSCHSYPPIAPYSGEGGIDLRYPPP